MDYLVKRLSEPSTYVGIGLFALVGGGVDWAVLSSIDWNEVLSMASAVLAVLLREKS